jgi:bifunctional non-homologous end joining protein LigD
VRPELVVEVDFTELTDGGHVRHGVFKGLREDKRPAQVTLESADKRPAQVIPERAGRGETREPGEKTSKEEYHGIRISNPHRVVFPRQGITKADLAVYYDAVAARILPHAARHPLSLVRCPGGRNDKCFFQKHASAGFPDELKRVKLKEKSGKRADYLYVDGIEGVIAAVQMGTLEFHIWGSRIDAVEKPDRLVFDLDPDDSLDFPVVSLAAAVVRQRLSDLGLQTVALVTGGKGVHVIAPLRRTAEWPEVKSFARAFATRLANEEPDIFVATASKQRRRGRIFVDWLRNERGATAIAPYSTRAREGGPVATPVAWDELKALTEANAFHTENVISRMNENDPWAASSSWRQSITAKMLRSLE